MARGDLTDAQWMVLDPLQRGAGAVQLLHDLLGAAVPVTDPTSINPGLGYWRVIRRETRSAGSMRWSWLSSPMSMRTQSMDPVKALSPAG